MFRASPDIALKIRNILFTIVIDPLYADQDPVCPDGRVMILQAQARMAKICHLFQDLEPRHIFLISADLVQDRALHIERGLGRFKNGGHIDLRIEVYLDALDMIVTLGLFLEIEVLAVDVDTPAILMSFLVLFLKFIYQHGPWFLRKRVAKL